MADYCHLIQHLIHELSIPLAIYGLLTCFYLFMDFSHSLEMFLSLLLLYSCNDIWTCIDVICL